MSKKIYKYLGFVSVDSGTLMVADPCYWIDDKPHSWSDYVKEIGNDRTHIFKHELGHAGKGVMVGNFGGDGCYSMFAEVDEDGIQKRIVIDLDGSYENELL